jgi:hypothetical protein
MVPLYLYLTQVVIAAEEKLLASVFGDDFTAYCRDVPRWLLRFDFGRAEERDEESLREREKEEINMEG